MTVIVFGFVSSYIKLIMINNAIMSSAGSSGPHLGLRDLRLRWPQLDEFCDISLAPERRALCTGDLVRLPPSRQ